MRIIFGTALALLAVETADAQALSSNGLAAGRGADSRLASALNAAAFSQPRAATRAPLLAGASNRTQRPLDVAAAELVEGPFAAPLADGGDAASLLDGARYDRTLGLTTSWDAQQFILPSGGGGAVDTMRLSVSSPTLIPGLGPRDLQAERFSPDAFDVTVTRGWPRAVSFNAGAFDFDVSPHAGLGVGNAGGSAEAGAVVRVGQNLEDRVVDALGAGGVMDGSAFGNRNRWYLFAAASGRAVGLNMLRQDGDWSQAGWSQDRTSSLIGDAQLGVGWRRGAVQTSFGYVRRTIKMKETVMGLSSQRDSLLALSFSYRPSK